MHADARRRNDKSICLQAKVLKAHIVDKKIFLPPPRGFPVNQPRFTSRCSTSLPLANAVLTQLIVLRVPGCALRGSHVVTGRETERDEGGETPLSQYMSRLANQKI